MVESKGQQPKASRPRGPPSGLKISKPGAKMLPYTSQVAALVSPTIRAYE